MKDAEVNWKEVGIKMALVIVIFTILHFIAIYV